MHTKSELATCFFGMWPKCKGQAALSRATWGKSVFQTIGRSVCLSVCLSACMHACMSACLPVYLVIQLARFRRKGATFVIFLPVNPVL